MKVAICLGGAPTVWDELAAAVALVGDMPYVVVACNFAGIHYTGHLDAWVSLHPERLKGWMAQRAAAGFNTDYRAFVHEARRNCPAQVQGARWSGSSGLYAADIALGALDCTHAILCGVPMEAEAGHIARKGSWDDPTAYRPGFIAAKAEGAPIRSLSGWTAELLGRPDAEWLGTVMDFEVKMRITMLQTHNFKVPPRGRQTIKYIEGESYTVRREWGDAMVADGKAIEDTRTRQRPTETSDEPAA